MLARPRHLVAVLAVASLLPFLAPASALATTSTGVTLTASPTTVAPGGSVTLSVAVTPAAAQPVSILDASDAVVASGTTDANGTFDTMFSPPSTVVLHASSLGVDSSPVTVTVASGTTPTLRVRTGPARLFDRFRVSGSTSPRTPNARVKVQLLLGGKVVAAKGASTGAAGRFAVAFRIDAPGRYRARAAIAGAGGPPSTDVSAPTSTPLPNLAEGAHGAFVLLLERRLVQLDYHLTGVDQSYDFRTADAVMAFRKVQGLPRVQTVTPAVWHALAAPRIFLPRVRTSGFHIEVDQTRQVLALVHDGKATAIVHVSTGKPSTPTRDGTFHVFSKLAGYSSKGLYYPSFFDGGRAIHGWPDVPTYNASHGCVRIPEWMATWMYGLDPIGTTVVIYH